MSSTNIPQHLQIRILHADDDIIVVDKPANLRSVPGHADSPTDTTIKLKRPSDRLTAVEAWIQAINSISFDDSDSYENEYVKELLQNISTTKNMSSIPRKLEPFARYVFRNRKRLLPSYVDDGNDDEPQCGNNEPPQKKQRTRNAAKQISIPPSLRSAADEAFSIIQQLHIPLMNLPTPTQDWESAQGQLRLLGYGDFANENNNHKLPSSTTSDKSKLHVVHRLDCQTSGVLLFARNPESASILCKAWRERDAVQKVYLAHVLRWPPYMDEKVEEGTIDLPLAASRKERIKWEVRELDDGGKPSTTKWKMYKDDADDDSSEENVTTKEGVFLELHPITGRTHQLRIHCAEIGSGIVGDSLYGDSPVPWDAGNPTILKLHAQMLSLRHPSSGEQMTFRASKLW